MSPALVTGCAVMVTASVNQGTRPFKVRMRRCGQASVVPVMEATDEFGPYLTTPMCADHVKATGRSLAVAS